MGGIRKMWLSLIVIVLSFTVTSFAGLQGLWEFEGNYNDTSGNSNHGTVEGSNVDIAYDSVRDSNVLVLDSNDGWIEIANESNFDFTSAMTITAWIKADLDNLDDWANVVKKLSAWRLGRHYDKYFLIAHIEDNRWCAYYDEMFYPPFDDEWHFVGMTYDGNEIIIYVDGSMQTKSVTGDLFLSDDPVRIGQYFTGRIDDVRIYDNALSEQEMKDLAGVEIPENELIGLWEFEGDYNDTSGYDNHGFGINDYGFDFIFDLERGEQVLYLDGYGWVEIPGEYKFDLDSEITVTAWVKADINDLLDWATVVCKFQAWTLGRHWDKTWLGGYIEDDRWTANFNMAFDNEWHFIAMAYDGNNLTTYIDQTKNTKQVTGPLQQSDSPLRLGGTGGTSSLNVTGYIDDIAIYSYGLTPEEVHENTCSLAKYDLFYSPTAGWDCTIDFQDMAVFAEQWHQTGEGLSADFNSDQIVDIDDLGEFLGFWLYEE